jgi:arsenical pump membrane protein
VPPVIVNRAAAKGPGTVRRKHSGRGTGQPGTGLAVLIGVSVGPNLSYAGSLATLLWRRLLADRDHSTDLAEFTRLGLLTVPAGLALATVALWAVLHI